MALRPGLKSNSWPEAWPRCQGQAKVLVLTERSSNRPYYSFNHVAGDSKVYRRKTEHPLKQTMSILGWPPFLLCWKRDGCGYDQRGKCDGHDDRRTTFQPNNECLWLAITSSAQYVLCARSWLRCALPTLEIVTIPWKRVGIYIYI